MVMSVVLPGLVNGASKMDFMSMIVGSLKTDTGRHGKKGMDIFGIGFSFLAFKKNWFNPNYSLCAGGWGSSVH